MNKESEITLFVFADQFYQAAFELEDSKNKNHVAMPSYYLYAHSIELAYKSFLFSCGIDLDYLKKEIGHNLEKALVKSKENGLDKKLTDEPGYVGVIKEINKYYVTKEFEYMTHTAKTLPLLYDVKKAAERTISVVFDVVNGYM